MPIWAPQYSTFTIKKTAVPIPATTTTSVFSVANGPIKISGFYGEVTTQIQAIACDIKWIADPTTGTDKDLCASRDINGDAVGERYSVTGAFITPLDNTDTGVILAMTTPQIIWPGNISLNSTASPTGAITWWLVWAPVSVSDGVIVA